MKTTIQEKYLNTPLAEQMFSTRAAKDIYIGQKFKFSNDREYTVENVYAMGSQARINVGYDYFPGMGSAPAWFTPGDGFEWDENSLGQGMKVITPSDGSAIIETILANRVCCCIFPDGKRKSYKEEDLKLKKP